MTRIRIGVVTLLAWVLAACGAGGREDPDSAQDPSSTREAAAAIRTSPSRTVSVSLPPSTVATLGTPVQLVATVKDRAGKAVTGTVLTWSSADTSVATVDAAGRVTPLRVASTSVTARAGGLSATTTLSVRGSTPTPNTNTNPNPNPNPNANSTRSKYVGTNLSGIAYYSTQFPFADLMKSGMPWTSRSDSGAWGAPFPAVAADGTPTALAPGQHALSAVAWDNSHYLPGRYVVLWDGDGALSFPLSKVSVAESSANRIAIDVTDTNGPLWVGIDKTNPANPVRDIRFLWPGTEATHASQPFNPVFLKKIAPFSMLRFMDWGATNGSPVVHWADRARVSDPSYAGAKGVPLELMIDLANTLQADPWFCIPHQASDDYVTQFATLLRDRLDPGLRPHVEYSNEVWNSGFAQTKWAVTKSEQLGLPRNSGQPSAYYAQRSVEMFKIIRQVYGPTDSPRVVRVIAGQAAWTQFQEYALAWRDTAANTDVMAVAPYFSAAAAAVVGNVNASLALSSDQIVDQMLVNIRGEIKARIAANAALARKYNLKLKAYEGGPDDRSAPFAADKQDALTALFSAAHRNPRMRDVYAEYLNLWVASGGDTMNQYHDIGAWSKWGLWGSLEYVTQDPGSAPKYQGLMDFIATHPSNR